jgi:hypothetical protein
MTEKWIKDSGIVIAIICLIFGLKGEKPFIFAAIVLLLLSVLFPRVLYPIAYVWLKLAQALNLVMPKILFTLIFFCCDISSRVHEENV